MTGLQNGAEPSLSDGGTTPSASPSGNDAGLPADEASSPAPDDAGDPLFDAALPPDAFFDDDANAPVPDAGCALPSNCDAAAACCGNECNAVNRCVTACLSAGGECGNAGACCLGLKCDETYRCQNTCRAEGQSCSDQSHCCLGARCRGWFGQNSCQRCGMKDDNCGGGWDCCSGNCGWDHHCN
jgi:hypothetical protein